MCETTKCTVNIKRIQLFLESEQIYRANLNIYKNNNTRYILCHLFENGKVFLLQSSNYSCIKFNSVSFFNLFIKVIFFLSPFCKYNFIVTITHMVFSYEFLVFTKNGVQFKNIIFQYKKNTVFAQSKFIFCTFSTSLLNDIITWS